MIEDRIAEHMHVLCEEIGERHLGSQGEQKAIAYIEQQLADFGYDVIKEPFNAPGWKYDQFNLSLLSNDVISSVLSPNHNPEQHCT